MLTPHLLRINIKSDMLEELYKRISPACCYITIFLDDEKISEGTGFSASAIRRRFTVERPGAA